MTEGEYRVGVDFNPSNNPDVVLVKEGAALLIDMMHTLAESGGTGAREAAVAATHFETAAMWAVKALTKKDRY